MEGERASNRRAMRPHSAGAGAGAGRRRQKDRKTVSGKPTGAGATENANGMPGGGTDESAAKSSGAMRFFESW